MDTFSTNVSQAFYGKRKDALIVTLGPGTIVAKQVQFTVRQLDPSRTYTVIRNGKVVGRLHRKVQGKDEKQSMTWREDGTVLVPTAIAKPQTFIFSVSR